MAELSVQVLGWTEAARQWILRAAPRWLKVLDLDAFSIRSICDALPGIRILYRHYRPADDQRFDLAEADRFADDILKALDRSGVREKIALVEGYNETGLWNDGPLYNRWTVRFAERMHREGLAVVAYNFATGNPPELWLWKDYLEGLRASDYLGLHEYGAPRIDSDAGWQSLRYRKVRDGEPTHGWGGLPFDLLSKPILITECGIDGGNIGRWGQGWRAFTSAADYASQLDWLAREWARDRVVQAGFLFCCGTHDPQWRSFDVSETLELADAVRAINARWGTAPSLPHPISGAEPTPPTKEGPIMSNLYLEWVRAGGDGSRDRFVQHLRAIFGLRPDQPDPNPVEYGFPIGGNPNLGRARDLARQLLRELGG